MRRKVSGGAGDDDVLRAFFAVAQRESAILILQAAGDALGF